MAAFQELQAEITEATVDYSAYVGDTLARVRPLMRQQMLAVHGDPTLRDDPAQYFDTLRMAEEAVRRPILRGLGHLVIEPLMQQTIANLDRDYTPWAGDRPRHSTGPSTFVAELSRGRVHDNTRGNFVHHTDKRLRAFASTAFCALGFMKQVDLSEVFTDVSQHVREYASLALDHRLGKSWRNLDPNEVSLVKVTELDGRKLSRYDRKLLLTSQKPLDVRESFSNATATAAEFTAISLEGMRRSLSKARCPQTEWYPKSFAHINKLSFGAKLPFWTAQDFAIKANEFNGEPLFEVGPRWPSRYHVRYAKTAHQNYIDSGNLGNCQGISPPDPNSLAEQSLYLRRRFISEIRQVARKGKDSESWPDMPKATEITSADAATALGLSIAYRDGYNL